jgi:hypothetical protein
MELDLPRGLRIIQTLSKIDGSVGWCVMIGAGAALFAPLLPRDIYDMIYRDGPDADWRVNGRWPFASGCRHADWLLGLCVMKKNGKLLLGPAEGVPMLRGLRPGSAQLVH